MNKSKGFTIIELIVVIAIIAILASIVLVNVTQYISKAHDAAIKSDMSNIATGMATCFSEYGSYSNGATPAVYCVANTAYVPATLSADITKQGGTLVTTAAPTTAYCASSKLASDAAKYVCIDSTGVTKESATAICTTSSIACPD